MSLSEDTERLAIQPEDVHNFSTTSIRLEEKENSLYMYVSAVGPKETKCMKLIASFSGNKTFIDNNSDDLGKFEFCVNLSSFDIGYLSFNFYEYDEKEPSDLNNYLQGYKLLGKDIISNGETKIAGDKQFTIQVNSDNTVFVKITDFDLKTEDSEKITK